MRNTALPSELDAIDMTILRMMQASSDTPQRVIAEKLGVDDATVQRRLKRLKKEKYILRCQAVLDRQKLNFGDTYFAFVKLQNTGTVKFLRFLNSVTTKFSNAVEVYKPMGGWDLVFKVVARDKPHYEEFTRGISELENFETMQSMSVMTPESDGRAKFPPVLNLPI